MRIAAVRVRDFRGVRAFDAEFGGGEDPLAAVALWGPTGSGKTSVLQAIAWALCAAGGRYRDPADLRWPGLGASALEAGGRPLVEARVVLDDADQAQARRAGRGGREAALPALARLSLRLDPSGLSSEPPAGPGTAWAVVADRLSWFPAERRPARRDLAALTGEAGTAAGGALRAAFQRVLPAAPPPRPSMGIDDLSAGQRSVLAVLGPLLRHGSPAGAVVLVDTPELGLDPAAQQALVHELRDRVAPGQVLLATASDAVVQALPREACFAVPPAEEGALREASG